MAPRVVTCGVVVVAIVTGLAARPRYAEGSEAYVTDASGACLSVARLRFTWLCLTRFSLTYVSHKLPPSPRRVRKAVWRANAILARAVLTSMRGVR